LTASLVDLLSHGMVNPSHMYHKIPEEAILKKSDSRNQQNVDSL